jgi:DNA-binding GntR family transcriptional regulator
MRDAGRVARSVAQHDAIIAALERRDHAEASQRLREKVSGGLPELTDASRREDDYPTRNSS